MAERVRRRRVELNLEIVFDGPDRKDVVRTRLSEGVLFSKRMYVPPEHAQDALRFYLDNQNLDDTLKKGAWKFIRLI